MSLVQWLPKIARVTDDDIALFGPQAEQVRGLLNFIKGMSPESYNATAAARNAAKGAAWNAAGTAVRIAPRNAAGDIAGNVAVNAAMRSYPRPAVGNTNGKLYAMGDAAGNAARSEVVSDLIEPEVYKILTDPLNAGRVLDLRAPEAGSEFMRLIRELTPATADDVERIADLSVDPRMQGILELLQGLQGGMPLTAKINAARRLDRASRQGRRMQ